MFQILGKTNIDFTRRSKAFLTISAIAVVVSLAWLMLHGVERGIEFSGGTELQLKFARQPDLGAIRAAVSEAMRNANIVGAPSVTSIGAPEMHEVSIRLVGGGTESEDQPETRLVIGALRDAADTAAREAGKLDLNQSEEGEIRARLASAPGVTAEQAEAFAAELVELRRDRDLLGSVADISGLPGLTPEIRSYLDSQAFFGSFAVRSQSYIGPAIGRELLGKARWAVLGSLLGVLLYIWFRFQLVWGLAAVIALAHDTIVTMGLFSLFQYEFSLPVLASFLTLIGYSVNDTVVIFDRIRENLKAGSNRPLAEIANLSVNQTLSRTVITSGLTWLSVVALWLFGGEALRGFAFVMVIGVIVGSYSTICVASALVVLLNQYRARREAVAPAAATSKAEAARGTVARKVRSGSAPRGD